MLKKIKFRFRDLHYFVQLTVRHPNLKSQKIRFLKNRIYVTIGR